MSKDNNFPHKIIFTDSVKKDAERVAALLKLNEWYQSFGVGMWLALEHAEAYVKGHTEVVFCTPEQKAMLENNPKFVEALCEEGVVEWLTPFVLTKSSKPPQP